VLILTLMLQAATALRRPSASQWLRASRLNMRSARSRPLPREAVRQPVFDDASWNLPFLVGRYAYKGLKIGPRRISCDETVLEMGEDEGCAGDVADLAGAEGDVLERPPGCSHVGLAC
jgi:hypothetical protein